MNWPGPPSASDAYRYALLHWLPVIIIPQSSLLNHSQFLFFNWCLFSDGTKNYYRAIADNKEVSKGTLMLNSVILSLRPYVAKAIAAYNDYQFLWMQDKEEIVAVWFLCTLSFNFTSVFRPQHLWRELSCFTRALF